MAEVEKVASVSMTPCTLASGSHGGFPFLAAGSRRLHLFPTNPTTGLPAEAVTTFRSPADFSSLDWSKPTEATLWRSALPAGLIAGGLDNGVVAIWDPCTKLGDLDSGSRSSIIHDYIAPDPEPSVPFHGANMMAVSSDSGSTRENDAAQAPVQGLEYEAQQYPSWAESNLNEDHFVLKDLHELPSHHDDLPPHDYSVLLRCHSGPVHGLSFSPQHPNFLSSGSVEGEIVVWDITNPSLEAIPTLQFTDDDNVDISHLSWSPLVFKLIASASNLGAALWDVSAKSHLIRKFPRMTGCSHVEWSPRDENLMVVAAGDLYDLPAVKVWDLRNMEHPLFQCCEKTGGVLGLSWSPFDNDILVGCTNNKKVVVLSIKKGQVVHEMQTEESCFDICWTKNMEDHFAVSCSDKINLYRKDPEI